MGVIDCSMSMILPVHNECGLLAKMVHVAAAFLDKHFCDYEIIIVESGSTDGTAELADRLPANYPKVRVLHEGRRNGFGSALRLGFAAARNDLVLLQTVDMPYPLEVILEGAALISRYDCVLSYRSHDDRGAFRKIQSLAYNTLVKLILGLRCRHVNSAFKLYRRGIIQSLPLVSKGWLIDAEILLRLQQIQANVCEIPVPLLQRAEGQSSIGWLTPLRQLRDLFTFALAHKNTWVPTPKTRRSSHG